MVRPMHSLARRDCHSLWKYVHTVCTYHNTNNTCFTIFFGRVKKSKIKLNLWHQTKSHFYMQSSSIQHDLTRAQCVTVKLRRASNQTGNTSSCCQNVFMWVRWANASVRLQQQSYLILSQTLLDIWFSVCFVFKDKVKLFLLQEVY